MTRYRWANRHRNRGGWDPESRCDASFVRNAEIYGLVSRVQSLLTELEKVVDHCLLVATAGCVHAGNYILVEIGEHLDELLKLFVSQSGRPLGLLLLLIL